MAANRIHIRFSFATDDEGVPVRKATQEHEAAFVMLNEFDAVAGAAAASEFGGGTEGGMGKDEHACGWRHGLASGGDEVAGAIGDESGENAGMLED